MSSDAEGSRPPAGEIRVVVEPILEPPGDVAVYRVRVWTAVEKALYLDFDGGQITQPLAPLAQPDGLWLAELVILVALRPNPDATLRANAAQLEYRLLRSGGGGGLNFTENVPTGGALETLLDVPAGVFAKKFGQKQIVARLNGKVIEVSAAR